MGAGAHGPGRLRREQAAYAAQGHTPVAVDGEPAAVLAFGDRVREEAAEMLASMRASGKVVYLLSGDHPEVVRSVAAALDLPESHVRGGVTPEQKQAFVERLQAEGRTVAMVGDGVNDAAALQAAHVGIAVHSGSTASLVAADVFLTRAGLRPLAELFGEAGHVMHVIRRNLGLSLFYNVLGAAAAIFGLVGPLVAAVAMPISSLIVVASSILQRSFQSSATSSSCRAVAPPARVEPSGEDDRRMTTDDRSRVLPSVPTSEARRPSSSVRRLHDVGTTY